MNWFFIALIGFFVGFIVANFIFYSNNPTLIFVMNKIIGKRPSMMLNIVNEDKEYGKRHKVRYQE